MYDVTLIHLTPDARSAAADLEKIERRDVPDEEMRNLLRSFCGIDAVENVAADPEIKVKVRRENYLIRTGQTKLILYDLRNRETPGLVLTVEQVMAELDGSAYAARKAAVAVPLPAEPPVDTTLEPYVPPPPARPSLPRVIAMAVVACALGGALVYLLLPSREEEAPVAFSRMDAAEAAGLQASLAGVYMTGTQPGQHGIALTTTGELRLFELRAVDAPRMIHATGRLGRVGPTLCLDTDQPGGLITLPDRDTMVYCGETFKRIP